MASGRLAWSTALLATGLSVPSSSEALCTLTPLEMRLRMPQYVAFIGTAEGDTLLAGPGATEYGTEQGHYGPGTRRTIYGQLARVDRLERAAPATLREAVGRNPSVVLVPWDFDASCSRVPWPRSARWLSAGTRGVFVGKLRDRAHWVGDRPTFDVTPEVAIYPSRWTDRRRDRAANAPRLSAEEFLSLYEVLPDGESLYTAPDSAAAPLLGWASAHPEWAAKEPAAHFLRYLRREVIERRYLNRPSRLAGTYRVVYRTAVGDSVLFFARTELRPNGAIWSEHPALASRTGTDADPRPIGHYLLVVVRPSLGALPTRRAGSGPEGYFAIVDSAVATTTAGTVFAGSIDLEREAAALVADSAARSRLAAAGRAKSELQTSLFRRNEPLTPGRFVMSDDGRVLFDMVIERDGTPVLTVRAERLTREHLEARER